MKNHRFLLLIPFLALTGCQTQKEITYEEAKDIIQKIQKNTEYGSFEFNLSNKGEMGRGEEKSSVDLVYKLKATPSGYYSYIKGVSGSEKYNSEMYFVNDSKYGQVKYIRYFDEKQNEYVKAVSTSQLNDDFEEAFSNYGVYRPRSLFDYYAQVGGITEQVDEEDTRKIYSSKEGQLTISITTDLKNYEDKTEEWVKGGKTVYKYEDFLFKSINASTNSTYDNTWVTKGSATYNVKDDIKLPSDWENYITLEA